MPYFVAPWPGWLGPDYSGYSDDTGYSDAQPASNGEAYGPPDQSAPGAPDSYDAPPPDAYQHAPARPVYQPPTESVPAPLSEDAVTLIFKDGRPDEQIHNYVLTRNALYVQDQDRRTIPLEQLDLVATAKVNRQAGADFQIPNPPK